MAKQFCIQELRKRLGFNEVEQIAENLLSTGDPLIIKEEALSILGESPSTNKFVKDLLNKLKTEKSKPKPKAKAQPKQQKQVFLMSNCFL